MLVEVERDRSMLDLFREEARTHLLTLTTGLTALAAGTPVKVDELQRVLVAVNSFDQIYEAMHEAEQRVERGSL